MMEESSAQGTTLTNQVTVIPGRNDWRPPYHYKPLADGDEVATVVGPKGEEIYVNEDGAVRVHFHWNRYDAANDNASCWVRVAQGWNGNGFGFLAIPRIGQEVIISYLNGDIDQPIVTGCTYNGLNRPPLDLPAEKTRTTLKTKTYKGEGFNELRFDDAKDKQEVFIHAQRDMKQEVKHQMSTLVGDSQFTHIHKDKHSRVEGEVRNEIFKDCSLLVHQDAHFRIKQKFLLEGMEEVHLQSREKLVLDASEEIVLKVGGSFISITAAGIQITPMLNVGAGTPGLGTPAKPKLPLQLKAGINTEPGVSQPVPQQIYRPVRFNFSS